MLQPGLEGNEPPSSHHPVEKCSRYQRFCLWGPCNVRYRRSGSLLTKALDIYYPTIRVRRDGSSLSPSLPRRARARRGEQETRLSPQAEVQMKKHCDSDRRCREARWDFSS